MRPEHLRTEPPDETVDFGPIHSPSALVGCTTVLGLLALIFLIVWLATGATLLVIPTLLFGAPSIICLILSNSEEQRDGTRRPESAIDVLRETLKFKLTHGRREVGVTAFFRPDAASPGQATCLLIFMQSCATRSRRLHISFAFRGANPPPHFPALHLHLCGGQAAVYRLPMLIPPDTRAKEFACIVRVKISRVRGLGHRLFKLPYQMFSGQMKLRPSVRIAEVGAQGATPGPKTLGQGRFLSLHTLQSSEPDFSILHQLTVAGPEDEIEIVAPEPHAL